jgi:hypothetical protein
LRHKPMKAPAAEIVLPVAGVALLIYTIYRNVVPYPTGSSAWLPVAAGVWLLVAVLAVLVAPSFSRRLGERLVTDEGFEVADVAEPGAPGAPGAPGESLRRPATA